MGVLKALFLCMGDRISAVCKKEKKYKIVMMRPESYWNEWQHFLGFGLLGWEYPNKQTNKKKTA